MFLIPVIYLALVIIHAGYHWWLIKRNITIKSWRKTLEWSIISSGMFFIFPGWPCIVFSIVTRAAFFDPILNILRGKPFSYEGEISSKKSFTDWLESETGINIVILRIFYLTAYIGYLIFYYARYN